MSARSIAEIITITVAVETDSRKNKHIRHQVQ